MYVLHACWLGDPSSRPVGLALWAETSTGARTPPRRRGRQPRLPPHPYAASTDELRALLLDRTAIAAVATLTLTLPTRAGGPVPSPELVGEDVEIVTGETELAPWQVPALTLDADAAYGLFGGLVLETAVAGASIGHLVRLVEFAADLVGRGRVLPVVVGDPPRAVWRPVLTGPDAGWARVLAAALPSSVTAADPSRGLAGWAETLDALVDAGARAALAPTSLRLGRSARPSTRAWAAALTGPDRTFVGSEAEVAELATALQAWQQDAIRGSVRGCFRLTEPGDDGQWHVRFGLQAAEEPSQVADAAAVWRPRGKLPPLVRQLPAPQETLLAELGKAGRLYPDLDDALRTARPLALELDTDGAHRFLSEAAPALATAGFGVQLPGWWTKSKARLGLRVSASTPSQPGRVAAGTSSLGLESVAEFRYDLAVGDQVLTADELAELSELNAPLVRLRGQWIELDPRRLAAGLQRVGHGGHATIGDLLQLALSVGAAPEEDLPVSGVDADGWLGDLLSGRTEHRLEPLDVPDAFTGQLRPYQSRGLAWLDFLSRAGLGGVLADDMGLGKTVQLLALLAHDTVDRPTLLICPMSLVGNWQREAARFTPDLRLHVHHGAERARGQQFAAAMADCDLVVTTYTLAARDAADLRKINWRRVVVDEAQAIKNAATKQATAIRSIPAESRIAVTGTPVENRLADLWSILEFANPGLLGTATTFKQRYAQPIERQGDDDAAERLRRFTGPFILRRVKTDTSIITDLPEKLEMDLLCNLTAEQAAMYQAVVDDMLERIRASEGIERRGLVLATMTKLKQVCNHPAHFLRDGSRLDGRSGKLERLDEILDEVLANREKALIFTQYAEFGGLLRGHLTGRFGREVLFLHGGVAKPVRDEMVARFQADDAGSPPLFVLSLKAGGTGLTLTAANHVLHVDRWWNPAVEDQATDRAFRIGQRRAVQVRKFVCVGTLEEKIATMITDKRALAASVVGSSEQWLTELSTQALADLFRLEAEAVVE